jgi:hypothetical protein
MPDDIEKKPLTWEDIENNLKNAYYKRIGEEDEEKFNCFKDKIIDHLDNLQSEINDKMIIPFPQKKEEK